MPIRWRGVLIGTGCFLAGYAAAPLSLGVFAFAHAQSNKQHFANLMKEFERTGEERIVKMREEIEKLEAQGDAKSWDRAQEMKMQINNIRNTISDDPTDTPTKPAQGLLDWSYKGSASGSWSYSTSDPKSREEEKVVNDLFEGAILQLIKDLEAKGDLQSMQRAQSVKEQLAWMQKKQKVKNQLDYRRSLNAAQNR